MLITVSSIYRLSLVSPSLLIRRGLRKLRSSTYHLAIFCLTRNARIHITSTKPLFSLNLSATACDKSRNTQVSHNWRMLFRAFSHNRCFSDDKTVHLAYSLRPHG